MLALRLPEEIEGRLNALAKKTGRTKSLYVREDIYLAEKRLEDLQAGRSRTYTLEEVMERHGVGS